MRPAVLFVALLAVSCTTQPAATLRSPSPSPSAAPSPSPSAAASPSRVPSSEPIGPNYGLLIAGGKVEMINTHGDVAASAPIGPPTADLCIGGLHTVLQPPVSASMTRVYFRDGDQYIHYLTPDGKTGSVNNDMAGGASVASFFAVSPDDRKIAILTESVTGANELSEILYVQDLLDVSNYVGIYATTSTRDAAATTLWPMGWYHGNLLLALMPACTADLSHIAPIEWHVSSASTGDRIATIKVTCVPEGHPGVLSRWPSPNGVMCAGALSTPAIFSWDGTKIAYFTAFEGNRDGFTHADLSPSGHEVFLAFTAPSQGWEMLVLPYSNPSVWIEGHEPCLWIDEDHLLAPDAVIGVATPHQPFVAGQMPLSAPGTISPIALPGVCAGVYPNPL